MNQKQIKHITNKHYRELKKYIKMVAVDFDVEAIHQFRVEYKKLRAFFRLISQEHKAGEEIKISKKLKKAYHISGAVRDLQLQQQRIQEVTKKELKKTQVYTRLLQKEMDVLKPELAGIILDKPVAECKKKTDAVIPGEFQAPGFNLFIQKKWSAIKEIIISRYFSDDHIHTVRKCLKDLFYNLKIYETAEQDILSQSVWKGKDEAWFFQLLDELGNFQDKCTAIALMRPYWFNRLNGIDLELLERIKKRWIEDKLHLKQLLVRKLRADNTPRQTD